LIGTIGEFPADHLGGNTGAWRWLLTWAPSLTAESPAAVTEQRRPRWEDGRLPPRRRFWISSVAGREAAAQLWL